jgi:hypothetical protein
MQLDMHYYGTYAMARTAGLKKDVALAIATAAEFVDDSDTVSAPLADGAYLYHDATAHHPAELEPNTDPDDQRRVWLPFHFLPGNQGKTLEERLVCVKDSDIARELVEFSLAQAQAPFGAVLLGIAAHVYADTFSHYGFSGISSGLNRVEEDSIDIRVKKKRILNYISEKFQDFAEKFGGAAGNLLGLGHGSVATYPDRPYLVWSFTYKDGRPSGERNNPATYFEACQRLHAMFTRYAALVPAHADKAARVDFAAIADTVQGILDLEGKLNERCRAWQKIFESGLFCGKNPPEKIPAYSETLFAHDAGALQKADLPKAEKTLAYQFMQAAAVHREFVLKNLLPNHGLKAMVP